MEAGGGKAALIGVAVAALAAGFAAGWILGRADLRASVGTAPSAAPAFAFPLADAKKDEVLLLVGPDGSTESYRVTEAQPDSVGLAVEDIAPGGRTSIRRFRAARSFLAAFVILDGDIPPDLAEATVRDFIVEKAVLEDLRVDSLERTFHCLKVTGRYRTVEERTYWITDELPVHGVARIDGSHGKRFEVRSFSFGKDR